MKKILILLFLISLNSVYADVLIDEVLYDPSTSEYDTEYIELFNTGDDIDISGWKLSTSSVQAEIPIGTVIKTNTSFLVADEDNLDAWPDSWAEPDLEDEMSLTNSNAGIKLVDANNSVVDAVGWGNPDPVLFEGTPHQGVDEGYSLSRNNHADTDNNSADFIETVPNPENSHQKQGVEISILASVEGHPPRIAEVNLSPDDSINDGIQLMPSPGDFKNLNVKVIVEDLDQDVSSVKLNGETELLLIEQINLSHELYGVNLSLPFHKEPKNYSLFLEVEDTSGYNDSTTLNYEYLALSAFEIDTQSVSFSGRSGSVSEIIGDLDFSTPNPTVHNIGNTELDFMVSGTDLFDGPNVIEISNLEYTFLDNDFNASVSGVVSGSDTSIDLNLLPDVFREFSMRLTLPVHATSGEYSGSVYLTGVA